MSIDNIRKSFEDARRLLSDFVGDGRNMAAVDAAAELLAGVLRAGGKVMSCGNGGSMADAMHFAEELTGRFREDRPALPAIAVSDPTHLTCVGNDFGFDRVFSRHVEALGRPGDALLAISTSGNSPNVLLAVEAARSRGMKVVGLTGKNGGKMNGLCDVNVLVPWRGHSDRVQEIHIKVIHILIEEIERRLGLSGDGDDALGH